MPIEVVLFSILFKSGVEFGVVDGCVLYVTLSWNKPEFMSRLRLAIKVRFYISHIYNLSLT